MSRYVRPADEEDPIVSRDLDAADCDRGDRADRDDGPEPGLPTLAHEATQLALQPEDRQVGRELHLIGRAAVDAVEHGRLLALGRAQAQAGSDLEDRVGQVRQRADELAPPDLIDVAVAVHESLQQGQTLFDTALEVLQRYMLVAQDPELTQRSLQRVPGGPPSTVVPDPVGGRPPDPPAVERGGLVHVVPRRTDLVDDLLVGSRDGGARRGPVTEP